MTLPLLGLVMTVKDEARVIERCLDSVLEHELVDVWTVLDTGSTDATRDLVRRKLGHLPGDVESVPWLDFGWNRSESLGRARGRSRWLLELDADMTVGAAEGFRPWLARRRGSTAAFLLRLYEPDGTWYRQPRLVRADQEWRVVGRTHEYLDTSDRGAVPLDGFWIEHHADGSNRLDKLATDLALLQPDVEAGDPRATFYTAETFRALGADDVARTLYDRRAGMGGWDEEAWYASYRAARLRGSVDELLDVWRARPWRHEPLTAAAELAAADPRAERDLLFREPVKGG